MVTGMALDVGAVADAVMLRKKRGAQEVQACQPPVALTLIGQRTKCTDSTWGSGKNRNFETRQTEI